MTEHPFLNPTKLAIPEITEVKVEPIKAEPVILMKDLALIDTAKLNESLEKAHDIIAETVACFQTYYKMHDGENRIELAEMQHLSEKVAAEINRINEKTEDFSEVILLLKEILPLEKEVLLELKAELNR
jgi:hypothetical protein